MSDENQAIETTNPFQSGHIVQYKQKNRKGGRVVAIGCGIKGCGADGCTHIKNKVYVKWDAQTPLMSYQFKDLDFEDAPQQLVPDIKAEKCTVPAQQEINWSAYNGIRSAPRNEQVKSLEINEINWADYNGFSSPDKRKVLFKRK